jgi:two-component system cell cycle response regulator
MVCLTRTRSVQVAHPVLVEEVQGMKILVAQEDEPSRATLEAALAELGHAALAARDGLEALHLLREPDAPRLAILDRKLAALDGIAVCREVRINTVLPYTYLLLTCTKGQDRELGEGMKAGADDVLPKPFTAGELAIRLHLGRRILESQEGLQKAQAAIGYQTTHDPLTGLVNRSAILDTLQRELARAAREGTRMALILVGVDRFKQINETYGLAAGDAVLRETARLIRAIIRPYDSVGRYGGEEFLVIVPGSDAQSARSQAERMRSAVAGPGMDLSQWGKFSRGGTDRVHVTLSVGIAAGEKVKRPEPLLRAAEAALARAKTAGPDHIETATEADLQ